MSFEDPNTAKHLEKLTDKQAAFVLEYLTDFNITEAAKRAGYAEESAYSTGWDNLRNPVIRDAIFAEQKVRASRLRIDADWALLQFFDIYEASRRMGDVKTAAKAMENIGKYLGFYEKDNKQKGGPTSLDAIKAKLLGRGIDVDKIGAGAN